MTGTLLHTIDDVLLANIAKGDESAFAKLVHALYKRLFPFTASLVKSEAEADDILQEVFLKIWTHRQSFTTIENPAGWIFKITANTASNHLRSKLRHEQRIQQASMQMSILEDMEEKIDARFVQSAVNEAVEHLPLKRKMVFLLSKRDGLSRKEIAEYLHVSENTVRNQLSEAIKFIQNYLKEYKNPIIPLALILQYCYYFFDKQ